MGPAGRHSRRPFGVEDRYRAQDAITLVTIERSRQPDLRRIAHRRLLTEAGWADSRRAELARFSLANVVELLHWHHGHHAGARGALDGHVDRQRARSRVVTVECATGVEPRARPAGSGRWTPARTTSHAGRSPSDPRGLPGQGAAADPGAACWQRHHVQSHPSITQRTRSGASGCRGAPRGRAGGRPVKCRSSRAAARGRRARGREDGGARRTHGRRTSRTGSG